MVVELGHHLNFLYQQERKANGIAQPTYAVKPASTSCKIFYYDPVKVKSGRRAACGRMVVDRR
jgi:hypothetical protein